MFSAIGRFSDLLAFVEERTAQLRRSDERQRVLLETNNAIIANLDRASLFTAVAEALGTVVAFPRSWKHSHLHIHLA